MINLKTLAMVTTHRYNRKMVKIINILIGAVFIAGGIGYIGVDLTFYAAGTLILTAGIGEILIGE